MDEKIDVKVWPQSELPYCVGDNMHRFAPGGTVCRCGKAVRPVAQVGPTVAPPDAGAREVLAQEAARTAQETARCKPQRVTLDRLCIMRRDILNAGPQAAEFTTYALNLHRGRHELHVDGVLIAYAPAALPPNVQPYSGVPGHGDIYDGAKASKPAYLAEEEAASFDSVDAKVTAAIMRDITDREIMMRDTFYEIARLCDTPPGVVTRAMCDAVLAQVRIWKEIADEATHEADEAQTLTLTTRLAALLVRAVVHAPGGKRCLSIDKVFNCIAETTGLQFVPPQQRLHEVEATLNADGTITALADSKPYASAAGGDFDRLGKFKPLGAGAPVQGTFKGASAAIDDVLRDDKEVQWQAEREAHKFEVGVLHNQRVAAMNDTEAMRVDRDLVNRALAGKRATLMVEREAHRQAVAALHAEMDILRTAHRIIADKYQFLTHGATGAAVVAVADERYRQRNAKGYTAEHDDAHTSGELAMAAAAYAVDKWWNFGSDSAMARRVSGAPWFWPWSPGAGCHWHPRDARSNLIRAGALIVAEIERLDRAAAKGGAQ